MESLPQELYEQIFLIALSRSLRSYSLQLIPWNRRSLHLLKDEIIFAKSFVRIVRRKRRCPVFGISEYSKHEIRIMLERIPSERFSSRFVDYLSAANLPIYFYSQFFETLLRLRNVGYQKVARQLVELSSASSFDIQSAIIRYGNYESYQFFLELLRSVNVDERIFGGRRPVVEIAYLHHNREFARELIRRGEASVNTRLHMMMIGNGDAEMLKSINDDQQFYRTIVTHMTSFDANMKSYYAMEPFWGSFAVVELLGSEIAKTLTSEDYRTVRDFYKVYHHLKELGYVFNDAMVINRAYNACLTRDEKLKEDIKLFREFSLERIWEVSRQSWFAPEEPSDWFIQSLLEQGFDLKSMPFTKKMRLNLLCKVAEDMGGNSEHWGWGLL